jgi:Ca2+-transporting ATPase
MAAIALSAQAFSIYKGFHWQTIVFNIVCLSQMGHVLAIRSDSQSAFSSGFFSNPLLIGAVVVTFLLQFIITYFPFFHSVFRTESLSIAEIIFVVSASSLVFFAVEVEKNYSK